MGLVNNILAPHKDEVIRLYTEEDLTLADIAKIYNCHPITVSRFLKKNKVQTYIKHKRKYHINDNFLSELDSEDKAYFLGFMYADGCNNSDGRGFTICLNSQDKEILEKFVKILESDHPIDVIPAHYDKEGKWIKEKAQLRVVSHQLSADLSKWGCVPRKTTILKWPDNIPENLKFHFIRGYFDGDGCFSSKGKNAVKVSILSTHNFLSGLKEYLNSLGIRTSSVMIVKNKNVFRLDIQAQKSVKDFMDSIYKDATIFLERKHEKYLDYYFRGKSIYTGRKWGGGIKKSDLEKKSA